jgi:4-amino-4-deoxy-L-arabinose transferase-like glycosyltransferase
VTGGAFRFDASLGSAWPRHRGRVLAGAALAAAALLWVVALPHNPPCCYHDESSTAYNAWLIAQSGRDEYGARFPLYFEAFGEFRSPVQFYVMAGLFKVLGPHLLLGRYLTRSVAFLAILLAGWLGYRISRRPWIGAAVVVLGLATPQLYEISRLGTEAPLVLAPVAVWLLLVHRLAGREHWGVAAGALLALPLAVTAYTYPTGRPLAPVLAALLLLFARRPRWPGIAAAWIVLAVLMAPIAVFMHRHPDALSHYAAELSWTGDVHGPWDAAATFMRHLAGNVGPGPVLFTGDPNPRHHVGPWGAALLPLAALALGGLALVATRLRREPFWLLVAIGFVVSLLPATFTQDAFHEPRLILVPLFALVLSVPALTWLAETATRRRALGGLAAVGAIQAVAFFAGFVADGTSSERKATFQHDFARVYAAAKATGQRPIWVLDNAYVPAFWHAVLEDVPRGDFVYWVRPTPHGRFGPAKLAQVQAFDPPSGSVVLAPIEPCARCRVLARGSNYNAWIQP